MATTGLSNAYVQIYQDGVDHTSGATPKINGVPLPVNVTLAAAQGAANIALVTITLKDNKTTPAAIATSSNFDVWLSDAATGIGLTASAPTTASLTTGASFVANSDLTYFRAQTNASGVAVLSITNAAKPLYYVCVQVPGYPAPFVLHLATGNYG
jgi:hypothetical protein